MSVSIDQPSSIRKADGQMHAECLSVADRSGFVVCVVAVDSVRKFDAEI